MFRIVVQAENRLINALGVVPVQGLIDSSVIQGLVDTAGTSALSKVGQSTSQGMVTLAEVAKTAKYLANPLEGTFKLLEKIAKSRKYSQWRDIKLRRKGKTFGQLERTAVPRSSKFPVGSLGSYIESEWLAYRYAFRPLVFEVKNLAAAIVDLNTAYYQTRQKSTGFGAEEASASTTHTHTDGLWSLGYKVETTDTFTVRAGVLYDQSKASQFQAHFGSFRSQDWVEAAWEILPFSFVSDWWWNFGDYLKALAPKSGVTQLASWWTEERIIRVRREVTSASLVPSAAACNTNSGSPLGTWDSVVYESKRRIPGIQAAVTPNPKAISFVFGDAARAADQLALITQTLRRVFR